MTMIRLSSMSCLETVEALGFNYNLSKRSSSPVVSPVGKYVYSNRQRRSNLRCSLSKEIFSPLESEEADNLTASASEEELDHVMKFNISDFQICDQVSTGLGGRGDEEVFEALVKNANSPFYNKKLVLRRLTSVQAQRRGKRAIQVLKKLSRRKLLYHSYSMQVHGYACSSTADDDDSFTLVHGYHGSFSLRHWLQQADWLPTLEATLALDEESVKRVGDDTVGGSAVSRQLRIIRILMRDLLIGVNYLHSHGLAHTELRLENLHISPLDRHIKVGILGNAADFSENSPHNSAVDDDNIRRQMMIAFDMRCVGFIMAKLVLQELMDPVIFSKFKTFLTQGNDPSCLREFLLQTLNKTSTSGNAGLQILDRSWGAGWNLLSLLLASKPSDRIRCLDALRHPFLCGPRWRVDPSMDIIRWSLGSTTVRIIEEYIYGQQQRIRVAHFIELMEMLNCHSKPKNWLDLLPGKWRLLYSTGRHIGLTFRQPPARVLIGDVHLTVKRTSMMNTALSFRSDIGFRVLIGKEWSHDKAGVSGELQVNSLFRLMAGRRLYLKEEKGATKLPSATPNAQDSVMEKVSGKKWRKALPFEEFPSSLRVAKLVSDDIEVSLSIDKPLSTNVRTAQDVVQEVRTQIPPEMFDLSNIVCGTYVDKRLLVLRGVNGSALFFTRCCTIDNCT